MYATISLSQLPLGASLTADVHDSRQLKLLAAGAQVTDTLLAALRARGVMTLAVSQYDLARIHAFHPQGMLAKRQPSHDGHWVDYRNEVSEALDQRAQSLSSATFVPAENPYTAKIAVHGCEPYNLDFASELANQNEKCVQAIDGMMRACLRGGSEEIEQVAEVVEDSLTAASADFDVFLCLGANPYSGPYPSRHSRHATMIALAIGAMLGLDEPTLMALGQGCLLHDVGMLSLPAGLVDSNRRLRDDEFAAVQAHPIKMFDLIDKHVDSVSEVAQMVAYQMHERSDGSGYPRQSVVESIHPVARIASVADAYTALVATRPYRRGMLPYYAIETLARDAGRGLFDVRVVRALLDTVGLFPIGSYVELSNGCVARVIRGNGSHYTQPIVEAWKRSKLSDTPAIIDLLQDVTIKVARPLVSLRQ